MMTIRRLHGLSARPGIALGAACMMAVGMLSIFAEPVLAQQQTAAEAPQQAPSDTATRPSATEKFLSLSEIEQRVTATGIRVTEIEVKDRIVEVEGRDASNREVDLVVDRRSGEILSRKLDD
jgi:hypothetical protein